MRRIHININSDDLGESRRFYTALFGAPPTVDKPDYVKWMIEDPRINLAVTHRPQAPIGVDHVGIETGDEADLRTLNTALTRAGEDTLPEPGAQCCYARSEKNWAQDPNGVIWELFHTMEQVETYGHDRRDTTPARASCCE